MSSPIESDGSSHSANGPEVPLSLIALLREQTRCRKHELDPDAVEADGPFSTWDEALSRVCRSAGMVAEPVELNAREVCSVVRRDAPLVRWTPQTGWIIITRGTRGRVHLVVPPVPPTRIDAEGLASRLGNDADANLERWLRVGAGFPTASSRDEEDPSAFERLLEILGPEREDVLSIVLYAVFIGLVSLAVPIAVQQLVNTVAFGGLVQPVVVLAFLLLVGLAFGASLSAFQAYVAEFLKRRIFVRACVHLSSHLPRVSIDAFGVRHGPEQVNRFFDLITLQKASASLLLDGSAVLLQTVTGLLILSFYHPLMLGLSVLLVGAMYFVLVGLGRGGTDTAIRESYAKYALADWFEELVRHPAAFRSHSGRAFVSARSDALAASWVERRSRHFRIVLRQLIGSLGLQVLVNTLVLALGGFLVVSGELTLGQLVASEIIVAAVVAAFARLGKQLEVFYDLLAAVDKVGTLFDLKTERERGRTLPTRSGGARLQTFGVDHAFDGTPVLGGVSLNLGPGERIALTGPPASGKSILIDLICGLREPSTGQIEIDGEDLRELRLESLREEIVCIRDPEIFAGTILDNVRILESSATQADVTRALDAVGLLDEIRALPDGLDTRVATDGLPLTRSQIARLMIARALAGRPRLLAIDGELVHLEGIERERVLDAIFSEERPFTVIVVSRREDVLERVDRTVDLGDRRLRIRVAEQNAALPATEAG
ncbi:MAG: ABC transporter ATP-binding protein/permease [bacterium]|nr:ABC transporter ATP-binding protein/permease [bacterium]